MMNVNKFFFPCLFFFSVPVYASVHERITLDLSDISLKPANQKDNNALTYKSINIPPICRTQECEGQSSIIMYNGMQVNLQSTTQTFSSVVDGLDFEMRLHDASLTNILHGQGGTFDIAVKQGMKPYFSGVFNVPFLTYLYKDKDGNEVGRISLDIVGDVKSGICTIVSGTNLNFNFNSTINEINKNRNARNFVDIRNVELDCVNVDSVAMRFSSSDVDSASPEKLIDGNTGLAAILEYDVNGNRSDIYWDNSKNIFKVYDDKLNISFKLYTIGARVSPGQFSVTGVYHIEYN